jgi:hypothetical protein
VVRISLRRAFVGGLAAAVLWRLTAVFMVYFLGPTKRRFRSRHGVGFCPEFEGSSRSRGASAHIASAPGA